MIVESSDGHVKVMGFKLHYRAFGRPDKGTVLALHGGPGGTHDYLVPLADLAQFGYRIVLYDQRGCGKSEKSKSAKQYTLSRLVDEVEGVRKALKLRRIDLFGSSFGGALALEVALKYPRNLRSVMVSNSFSSNALVESEWNPHTPKKIRETLEYYRAKGDLQNPKRLAAKEYLDRTQECRLRVWPYEWNYTLEHFSDYVYEKVDNSLKGWDITDRLPEIKIPCLIITGEYDVLPPKLARVIHRGIRGSKLVKFENCSHLPMWEDRVAFIEVVRDFLNGI
jgi:proline iminopeptidase